MKPILQALAIAIASLLCACVDESPDVGVAERAAIEAESTDMPGEDVAPECLDNTDVEVPAASSLLSLAPAAASCPHGTRTYCNPSGSCRCCWGSGDYCCPIATPYIWCNLSGLCRCSATWM